jgi:SEC-C motif
MTQLGKQPRRHCFILNPYPEEPFASCPTCDGLTEQRKFPLVIHVDPRNPVAINKTCCYCPRCDLIIARKDELEAQLAVLFEEHNPALIGNDYMVLGTLDNDDWERGRQTPLTIPEMLEKLYIFQEVFQTEPADQQSQRPGRRSQRPRPRSRPARAGRKSPSSRIAEGERAERRPRRNDPCWCGSGKKYKNCHLPRSAREDSASDPLAGASE